MSRALIAVALLTLGLAACGQGTKIANAPPPKTGVYIGANDCAESELLKLEECSAIIEAATAVHFQSAKTYISLRLCEASEGPDHCERTDANQFRPQLQAFLVTFSNPPRAEPLYVGANPAEPGFQTINKGRSILAVDETVMFSKTARIVVAGNGT